MAAAPAPDQPGLAGHMVRYQVVVHHAGEIEAPLTAKLTLPAHAVAGLQATDAAADANAVADANAAAGKNVVAAGHTPTYPLAGRLDRAARSRDVTACVHDRLNAPAVACATDSNKLAAASRKDDSGGRRMAWIGSIVFGILAVVGALWLYRKVNPGLLTPASADRPAQPGGAPPE